MKTDPKKMQTLSLSHMNHLARPTDEKKLMQALADFPQAKEIKFDESAFKRAAIKALLQFAEGEKLQPEISKLSLRPHFIDNSNPEEFDFKPSDLKKSYQMTDAHIPDHLGIAPIARVLKLPFESAEQNFERRLRNSGIALQNLGGGINLDRMRYPWCCIGKVKVRSTYNFSGLRITTTDTGSGTMVGRNLMVTASHVIPPGAESVSIEFIPAYSEQDPRRPFESAMVTQFRRHKKSRKKDDVAGYDICVCRLDRNLGDLTGWMGAHYSDDDDFYYDASFCSGGYPKVYFDGKEMDMEINRKVKDIDGDSYDGKEIELENFTNHGWSGGPIFSWFKGLSGPRVCGVLSGSENDFPDPTRSVFAGGKRLLDLIHYGLDNWA